MTDRNIEVADESRGPAGSFGGRLTRILLLAGIAIAVVALATQAGAYLEPFRDWVGRLGIWGPVVFVAGYALAVIAFVPGSILTLAAGTIFGVVWGAVYVFIAATLGAAGAFLVARYFARAAIERRLDGNARFAAIDQAVGRQGFKIVALLRLSPIFPFSLLNYALGLTRVGFRDYVLASIGMIPGTLLYVYSGAIAGEAAAAAGGGASADTAQWALRIVGLLATLIVTLLVTRIARRALRDASLD